MNLITQIAKFLLAFLELVKLILELLQLSNSNKKTSRFFVSFLHFFK